MIERTSRLLLVACSENFCKTLGRILKRAGYEVDCAGSGDEALIRLAWNPYDAIISEVHLPGEVCGISLMQQVRTAGHDAPVIFLAEGETARIRAALASWPGAACLQMPPNTIIPSRNVAMSDTRRRPRGPNAPSPREAW